MNLKLISDGDMYRGKNFDLIEIDTPAISADWLDEQYDYDGFFLYGFLLAFDDEDLFDYFDPKVRNTSERDFDWFERVWSRKTNDLNVPYIGKLFSLSTNLPSFQQRFPDAKILYMVRDPLNVMC